MLAAVVHRESEKESMSEFIKMQSVGDSVEGEYLGSEQFESKPADPEAYVIRATIHRLRTADGAVVGIFGRPSLDPALAGKAVGQRIRIELDRKVEAHPGVMKNEWIVRDLP